MELKGKISSIKDNIITVNTFENAQVDIKIDDTDLQCIYDTMKTNDIWLHVYNNKIVKFLYF